jgi:hypothetical protein
MGDIDTITSLEFTSNVDNERKKKEDRKALIKRTGGVDYWPKKPIKDENGEYVIREFNLKISKDSYLYMTDEEKNNLEQLIRRVKHLKKYYKHLDRLTILRFLRARKNDVNKAEDMLRNMVAWWDSSQMDKVLKSNEAMDYYPGGVCGRDLVGDPIIWGRYGEIDPVSVMESVYVKDVQRESARRYALVHHMHRQDAKQLNEPIEGIDKGHFQMMAILDVNGLTWKHYTLKGIAALKMVLKIPGLMFPETLKKAIIVRPPRIFYPIWAIVKLVIDPKTVDKIVVVSGDNYIKEIEKYVHISQIPDWLGGNMITRGTFEETPHLYHDGWYDGIQKDGITKKGTISVGGIVPKSKRRHKQSQCCDVEMNFGNVLDSKYHGRYYVRHSDVEM